MIYLFTLIVLTGIFSSCRNRNESKVKKMDTVSLQYFIGSYKIMDSLMKANCKSGVYVINRDTIYFGRYH